MYEPGSKPEIFGKVGVCWRKSCDEEFRKYWRHRLNDVLPWLPDLDGMVIEIGVTDSDPHVLRPNESNPRQVLRLHSPPSPALLVTRNQDHYVLVHELTHWIHDEQQTDLFAMAKAPRQRDIHRPVILAPGYFGEATKAIRCGMEDAVADLAAMSLLEHGNRQLWFSKNVTELQLEAELAGAIDLPIEQKKEAFVRAKSGEIVPVDAYLEVH
jgi:hypothetical protein